MGDRANAVVKEGDDSVVLYTHWDGSELPFIVRDALKRGRGRWDDYPYLARIIFCEMVKGDVMGTTGYGISQAIGDGENRVITIDVENQTVQMTNAEPVGFEEFINSSNGWF